MRAGAPASAASPTRSTRSTSPVPRCRRAWSLRGRAPGRARTGPTPARRPPRTARSAPRRAQQPLLWHLHDRWSELQLPAGALLEVEHADLAAPGPGRADDARPDRRDEVRRLRELSLDPPFGRVW